MVAAMQYMGTPSDLGLAAVFVVGAAIIGAYTRHYFRRHRDKRLVINR